MPPRTATQRRRHTKKDMQRRQLLRQAVEGGHRISDIARMSPRDLRETAIGGCDNLEAFHSASGDGALPDRGVNP